ncbi:MAG: hypothetical protein R2941_03760 [Desulfobacterales bacterium]
MTQEDEAFNTFISWWKDKWKIIQEDFTDYYLTQIMPKEHVDALAGEHQKLREFQAAFNAFADQFAKELNYSDEKFAQRYRVLEVLRKALYRRRLFISNYGKNCTVRLLMS